MSSCHEAVWVCSVDIGKRNFAFLVEEFNPHTLTNLPKIPKTQRYLPDGTPSPIFQPVIDAVCQNGKVILFKNCDLTHGCSKDKYLDTNVFHNLTELLDLYRDYWKRCDAFVIEQQMSFGKRHNTMALKIGQHCFSYFAILFSRFKHIIEFPAFHKTQVLGCQKIEKKTKTGKISYKGIDKPARKKWSVAKATSILTKRGDIETLSSLTSATKRDDLCDVLCQLVAWKFLTYVDGPGLEKLF
jgi:hypothetical protein